MIRLIFTWIHVMMSKNRQRGDVNAMTAKELRKILKRLPQNAVLEVVMDEPLGNVESVTCSVNQKDEWKIQLRIVKNLDKSL